MKKDFMSLLTIIMVALMSVSFSSCSGDDSNDSKGDANHDARLIGIWFEKLDGYLETGFKFESDGTCYYNEWNKSNPEDVTDTGDIRTWSTSDNILTTVKK